MGVRRPARRGPFEAQVLWLARVLHRRDFPLDRLAHLPIAAAVLLDQRCALAAPVAELLREGAAAVERYAAEVP